MSSLVPVEVYGLQVPAGDVAIEADGGIDFPATFRITMAAIDPTAAFESDGPARSTLKLIKIRSPDLEDDEDEDEDDEYGDDVRAIEKRLGLTADDDEDDESSDEEANGGPSDPARSRKARAQALAKEILEGGDDSMDDADLPNGINGKGKAKVLDDEDDEDEDDDEDEEDIQEFVLCTLDPEKNYQQPLDITLNNESELCYFKVTGSHAVYLTGNWVIPPNEEDEDEEDEDYSDEDDLEEMLLGDGLDEDISDEDDELDALEDPRITEVASDDEEAPKLVPAKKGKNKRKADDSDVDVSMENVLEKASKPEAATNGTAADDKLSKKQKKKLKNNAGDAVPAAAAETKVTPSKADKKEAAADTPSSNGKKVQFAKQLEQGPTGGGLGVKVVEGVTLDDKKLGSGPAVKNGNTVEIRYIGKLKDGKVFDSNKKGKPFSFKVGKGEVVKGMDVGLRGMAAGGERRITIPSKLGYGSKGAGKDIPPNSDLIFEVKLLTIK